MIKIKKRISITNENWNLLSKLTENAKMNWFYEETISRKTISMEHIKDAYCAFLTQNFYNMSDKEILQIYECFTKLNVMTDYGRTQLINYFKEKN